MTLTELLLFFANLEREGANYAVCGSLAETLRGRLVLTERLEILIRPTPSNSARVRRAIHSTWADAEIIAVPEDGIVMRALPPRTPFYLDFIAAVPAVVSSERLQNESVIRVADSSSSIAPQTYSRPGFTLPERIAAVQVLGARLTHREPLPRGVRRYRSLEDMKAARDRWQQKHPQRSS